MSGGAAAQAGFVYQQDYAAFGILGSEAKRLLVPDDVRDCIASFKVEGRQTDNGPAWDVAWKMDNGIVRLRECKDTAITRSDRRTFYLRVRSEIAGGTDARQLQIGWVTDPGKQSGKILQHFAAMSQIALSATEIHGDQLPAEVENRETALAEAFHYLTHQADEGSPVVSEDVARALLAQMSIERFRAQELAASVERLAPTLFDKGAGRTIRELIQGQLSTAIQRNGSVTFTRSEFLAATGSQQLTLGLAGQLRDILTYHSAAPGTLALSGITWLCRPERPEKIWPLNERLENWNGETSCIVAAQTGVGKSITSRQMFAERAGQLNPHHVLLVETRTADTDVVQLLPQLCSMLCGVSPTWLAIDGLDQIEPSKRQAWCQTLARLLAIPTLTLVITVRREVLAAQDWMQEQLSQLPEIPLEELSTEQVIAEFKDVGLPAPGNQALLSCLQNTFLLSIYARTVSDADMPLMDRGEVTAFDIIDEYWLRRVTADSQGTRAVGDPERSGIAKRAAATHLADRTLAGDIILARTHDNSAISDGIETLCREGVLIERSTSTVIWSHTWLREYVAAARVLEMLETPTVTSVANAVCSIGVDHAARTAAVGACKWIVSHSDLGAVEDYVAELYALIPGLAREAITVLLEDSPRHLQVSKLPPSLIIEALVLAREMRAGQWLDQVAELPEALFSGPEGSDLQVAALQYESEMTGNG